MIKVGIIGADTPDAGELLRILIYHPEVDIMTLFAPSMTGHEISACHHGFIGERSLRFSDKINPSKLDAIFITDDSRTGREIVERIAEWPELRIINMSPSRFYNWENTNMEYGLSEINRKPLVRGARTAIIPSAVASVALISLYPLAANLLLPDEIEIDVTLPEAISDPDTAAIGSEIARQIKKTQNSFGGSVAIKVSHGESKRGMRVRTTLKCPLSVGEVSDIYESVYDDHNFTFMTSEKVPVAEVEGNQKCVLSFCKPGAGLLEIEAIGDAFLRGGAGDAVHMLNLLFALHEKVGLHLKSAVFTHQGIPSPGQASWFA